MEKTMPLSISNSKQHIPPRPSYWGPVGVFLFFFVLFTIVGNLLMEWAPKSYWRGDIPLIPKGDYVVNEIDSDHFDIYDVLYYGIGSAIQNAKKADVLLLGNSRTLFAFREEDVSAFSEKTGI